MWLKRLLAGRPSPPSSAPPSDEEDRALACRKCGRQLPRNYKSTEMRRREAISLGWKITAEMRGADTFRRTYTCPPCTWEGPG